MTKEYLVKMYKERYLNVKNIKKYNTLDTEVIRKYFDKLDPKYYYFISDVIDRKNVMFLVDYKAGYVNHAMDGDTGVLTYCSVKPIDGNDSTLFHELGHVMDVYLSNPDFSHSAMYMLKNGLTLEGVLNQELMPKMNWLYDLVLSDYKLKLDKELGCGSYDKLINDKPTIKEFKSLERKLGGLSGIILGSKKPNYHENKAKYDVVYKYICNNLCIAHDNNVKVSKTALDIASTYEVIIDLLSSKYEMEKLYYIGGHSPKYYKARENGLVREFFANMVSAYLTNNKKQLDIVKTYLPRSFNAFIELFNHLYRDIYVPSNKAKVNV